MNLMLAEDIDRRKNSKYNTAYKYIKNRLQEDITAENISFKENTDCLQAPRISKKNSRLHAAVFLVIRCQIFMLLSETFVILLYIFQPEG